MFAFAVVFVGAGGLWVEEEEEADDDGLFEHADDGAVRPRAATACICPQF